MKSRYLLLFIFLPISLLAQYTTPNEGNLYTLADLVNISDGVVTESSGAYSINDTLIISALDTLQIHESPVVYIAPDVLITIDGRLSVMGDALFTHFEEMEEYSGFRFNAESSIDLEGAIFEYGGGLKCLTADLQMVDCIVRYQSTIASTGAALSLSTGKAVISNCTFLENESAAIGSAANSDAAPFISNCTFSGNNTGNSNRPQINLGPSGADTTRIINNTVIGNTDLTNVGGIAISSLIGGQAQAIIQGNEVRDNRYGIAAIGNGLTTRIEENIIENNDTQGDPMLGGSGININATSTNSHVILNNQIRNNLWGITLQGSGMANIGELDNDSIGAGGNVFFENGNGGQTYALYNNTPNAIYAQGNCWLEDSTATLDDVSNVIYDVADDALLGEVFYDENACNSSSVTEIELASVALLYPNPALKNFQIQLKKPANRVDIFDVTGRRVVSRNVSGMHGVLHFRIETAGTYLIRISGSQYSATGKLMVQ